MTVADGLEANSWKTRIFKQVADFVIAANAMVLEGEFRHLSQHTRNLIAGAFLPSDDEYDDRDQFNTSNPSSFKEKDRWLVHVEHKGNINNWSSRLNYTSVSDIDYLRDLGSLVASDSADFDQALGSNHAPALRGP